MYAYHDTTWYTMVIDDMGAIEQWSSTRMKLPLNSNTKVFSSDNGGPAYWTVPGSDFQHGAGANNWPLKGSKVSNWEGGVRAAAFVSGGFVPAHMRGTKLGGYIHMADWYSTFCALAGVDPTDTVASRFGLPPIDSLDMWSYLSGAHSASPRTEVPLSIDYEGLRLPVLPPKLLNYSRASALIQGDMKLLEGVQILTYYQGPDFPNSTSPYGQFDDPRLAHLCVPGNAVEVLAAGTTLYSYYTPVLLHYTPALYSCTILLVLLVSFTLCLPQQAACTI
jgi:hypothetical protein